MTTAYNLPLDDFESREHLSKSPSSNDTRSSTPRKILPPTPPIAKLRSLKPRSHAVHNSATNGDHQSLNCPEARSDSTDSGVASGSATKRRSMDSIVSNRLKSTESDRSSPDVCNDNVEVGTTSRSLTSSEKDSKDEGPTFNPNTVAFHNKGPTNEKYLSTASDRAADHEVSYILMTSSPNVNQQTQDQQEVLHEEDEGSPNVGVQTQPPVRNDDSEATSTGDRSPTRHRHRDVASLLRQKKRHNERARVQEHGGAKRDDDLPDIQKSHERLNSDGSAFKKIEAGKYNSHRNAVTQARTKNDADVSKMTSRTVPKPSTKRAELPEPGTVAASSSGRPISEYAKGVSSDTHRSSVRYEPVTTEQSSSPGGRSSNRRKLLGNTRSSSSDSDECEEQVRDMDDVISEEHPLNSHRSMSSPMLEHRTSQQNQYGGRRGSSYLTRASSGNLLASKSGSASSPNDPRHHSGLPRMGTGAVQPSRPSLTSSHLPSPSTMYSQQTPPSVMTSRVTTAMTSDTEQYDPVVTTTLKPTYEVDETGMWNFSRGIDGERSAFGGYTPGIPTASLPPMTTAPAATNVSGNNTAARFMNKRPSLGGRHHFESNLHHRRESRQYSGNFKKFPARFWKRFSWKCTALTFILLSVLLAVSFVAFFLVQAFNGPDSKMENAGTNECRTSGPPLVPPPTVVEKEGPTTELQLRRKSAFEVPAGSFSWMQVYVEEAMYLRFNCSLSPKAQVAVYGRKGLRPSHTKFDFFERIDGDSLPSTQPVSLQSSFTTLTTTSSRSKRSVAQNRRVNTRFLEYLEPGTWHLAIYNDGEESEVVEIGTSVSEGLSECPNSCRGKGDCVDGKCQCFFGFQGKDCSQVSCSIHCRGNGVYAHGKCVCFSGWKGVDCGTRSDQCVDVNCGGHGRCGADGECECEAGYTGVSCQDVDCIDPTCSEHGVCVQGQCRCDRGWIGATCSEQDSSCPADCSGRGTFDDISKKCVCEPGWGGTDCRIAVCRPACHQENGVCVDGMCRCKSDWTGDACDVKKCDARCSEHGSCVNGVCLCDLGWNGRTCSFVGCVNDCSGHGNCIRDAEGDYYCACSTGWKGSSCNIAVEVQCTDGRDNDLDHLIDCQDPDCCTHRSCSRSAQCRGAINPVREASRFQGSNFPSTASFYDRVRFLIRVNGVQLNANKSRFDPRRVGVIRGQLTTADGSPLIGAKVQIDKQPDIGWTKTRADGWYDILANGGGSLTVRFTRNSFVGTSVTVFLPWNDYIIAPTTTMRTQSEPQEPSDVDGACDTSRLASPTASLLVSSVRAFTSAECSERGAVIPEIQAIRKVVNIPETQASLVYVSNRAAGYQSILALSLVDGGKPANLLLIHVKIIIQGRLFEKKFEPAANLVYTYEWSRTDAYGRKVYGNVRAKVLVGYEYESCAGIVWKTLMTTVQGYDAAKLWSLDIHHTYHPDKGTVYLGNGGQMRLNEQPPMMSTVMGNGVTRHDSCNRCDGPAEKTKLMLPVALASDVYGNVYVGDHNFIRKIDVNGTASSLYTTRSAPAKYYMATSPKDGALYFSDPNERRIYKLRHTSLPSNRRSRDLSTNYEVVAGTGAACYPLQRDNCGDGGPATSARLSSPKGLALDREGRLYFVDGIRIRTLEPESRNAEAFAGNLHASGTRPLPCHGSISLDQVEFTYPTDLAISHVDGSLYVLDADVVIRIDIAGRRASLAAGVPLHCSRNAAKSPDARDSTKVSLISPTSISVSSSDGALYISETNQKFIHRVRRVDPYSGRISTVAGADSACDCAVQECDCASGDGNFARSAFLNNPAAITCTPDGSLYIADQLNLRIRKVLHSLPVLTQQGEYNVADPDANQLYVFDSNGRHVETKNVITGSSLYHFLYTLDGTLSGVRDVNANFMRLNHDPSGMPVQIELPSRETFRLTFNQNGELTGVMLNSKVPIASFAYQGESSGLIRSSVYGKYSSSFYVYDVYGRLITAVSPTGSMTSLHRRINATKHTVTLQTAATSAGNDPAGQMGVGRRDVVISTEPGYICDLITTTEGAMVTTYKRWTDNSISVHYLDDSELTLETRPHPVLGLTAPFLAKRTIHLPADPLESEIVWRTRKQEEDGPTRSQFLLGRRMAVNGRNVLSLDYSQSQRMEKIYDDHTKFMLRVQYNERGLPTLWMPTKQVTPVNVTYDRSGHASTWQRGPHNELLKYDQHGNMLSTRKADGTSWRYTYGNKIAHLSPPHAAAQYTFQYDDNQNLQQLSMPSGISYTVDRSLGVGFVRTTFTGTDGIDLLVMDNNDRGNLLSVYYPGEKRKAIFRYDAQDHMTEILHDSIRTRMLRDPHSGELVSVANPDCTMRFHRNGPLVERHTMTSLTDGGMVAVFDYTSDANLRLSSIEVKVNGTRLPVEHYAYNDVSGKLTTFGQYRVIDLTANIYAVGTQTMTLAKQSDNSGRITETEAEVFSNVVYSMKIHHNIGGRVSALDFKIGMLANDTRVDFTYTDTGALQTVAYDGAVKWQYMYDDDGKLTKIEHGGTWDVLRYDKHGRLTSFGDLQYQFDQDGFLRQRGNEVFEYNSMGHLVKAYRLDNLYEIGYRYDGFGRLVARVDVLRNEVLRYIYADLTKPARLTHVYNATSGLITTYRYDVEGFLFAMERSNGQQWSVACDHAGTPLAVFNSARQLVKEIKYSPFGQVFRDSAPSLYLAIGFRGGIYDVTTALVRFTDRDIISPMTMPSITTDAVLGGRSTTEQSTGKLQNPVDYDALTGQLTSSGIARLAHIGSTPVVYSEYQVSDPVNAVPIYEHMTDTSSWLNALGFRLQNVAPDPQIASRQKDKSSVECQLSHHLSTYMALQTATPSALVPTNLGTRGKIPTPGATLFAQGLVLVVDRGSVMTQVLHSATDDVKRLSGIINGADVIIGKDADSASAAMSLTLEGKPTIYLTKSSDSFDKDRQTLRVLPDRQRILEAGERYHGEAGGGSSADESSPLVVSTLQNQIHIESGHAVVIVVYVSSGNTLHDSQFSTVEFERNRITDQALRRAENDAWSRERRKLQEGLKTRWSKPEAQEILTRGSLSSYSVQFTFDVERYPELAESGRNVKFVKKS